VSRFTFNLTGGNYLVWLGRFTPVKGAKEAIEIAKAVKMPLLMAGKIDWAVERDKQYFKEFIEPHFKKGEIEYLGEANHAQKNKLMGSALCLLNPISWDEPFGLVSAEANACGTPVVVFARGAAPEVIKDGETGFLINSSKKNIKGDWLIKKTGIEGISEAVERIRMMPKNRYQKMRRACREHVEKNFTIEKMADSYEKLYQEVLEKQRKETV